MMGKQLEALRLEVGQLLENATDDKMSKGNRTIAQERLQEARVMAAHVGPVWSQLAAYRLAHVLMRQDDPPLQEAEALFAEACNLDAMGPYPWIYRAAVLQRLDRDPSAVLHQARARLNSGNGKLAGIQAEQHNLLELALYFTGARYSLDGHGGAWEVLFPKTNTWALVGPHPETARIRYSRDLALAELSTRDRPGVVLFQADPPPGTHPTRANGTTGEPRPGWIRAAGSQAWRELAPQQMQLLALLLEGRCPTVASLTGRLYPHPGEDDMAAFRQLKRRLGETLAEVQDLKESAFEDTRRGDAPTLRDREIYGAVPAGLLVPPAGRARQPG